MKKSLFEHMGGTYHREGDYLLPDLTVPESPHIGIWGERHWEYLRKNKNGIYTGLLLSGKLNAYLEEIDRAAEAMYSDLIAQYAKRECVTEQLKEIDQMEWVRRMNSIRSRVEQAVRRDMINR